MSPARAASLRPRGIATLVLGALLVVGLLVAGLVALVRPDAGTHDGQAADAPVELEHVHGLGVDPADGRLYAGAHEGFETVVGTES